MAKKITLWMGVVVMCFITITEVKSQESTLWMRNGKKVTIANYSIDTDDYYEGKISFFNAKGKLKSKYLEDVFSIVDKSGKEEILYKQNIEFGEILSPLEMKEYVSGMGDANIAPISPMVFMGGVITGIGAAFIPQPEINLGGNSMGIPVGVLVPATYIAIMGATPPDADKLQQQFPEKASNEHYLMGYQEGVKKKRLKNSILGAGLGFIAGIIVVTATN